MLSRPAADVTQQQQQQSRVKLLSTPDTALCRIADDASDAAAAADSRRKIERVRYVGDSCHVFEPKPTARQDALKQDSNSGATDLLKTVQNDDNSIDLRLDIAEENVAAVKVSAAGNKASAWRHAAADDSGMTSLVSNDFYLPEPSGGGNRDLYTRQISDSIFDEACPDVSHLPNVVTPASVSRGTDGKTSAVFKALMSERSVSVFDEYYDDSDPVPLPDSDDIVTSAIEKGAACELDSSDNVKQHLNASDQNTPSVQAPSDVTLEQQRDVSTSKRSRLLSSATGDVLDAISCLTDSDLESSVCTDCISKLERLSVHSSGAVSAVTQHSAATTAGSATGRKKRRASQYSRQTSLPGGAAAGASTPGRCRSVTPTELNRRRCLSNTTISSGGALEVIPGEDQLPASPTLRMEQVPMPRSVVWCCWFLFVVV